MKTRIIEAMARNGWHKDRIVDAFSKQFKTAVDPTKQASVWLSFEAEFNRWWLRSGDFTSAGENVLATSHAILPVVLSPAEIEQQIAVLVADMERRIAGAFSVRLLRTPGPGAEPSETPLVEGPKAVTDVVHSPGARAWAATGKRIQCAYCGRSRFCKPEPHICQGNLRKRHLRWVLLEQDRPMPKEVAAVVATR